VSQTIKNHFQRFLCHPWTGGVLVFMLVSSVAATAALEYFSATGFEPQSSQVSQTTNEVVTSEAIDSLTQPALKKTLEAPPLAQLDGSQVNPFLLGVVGKENSPQAEAPPAVPVFDRERVLTDADGRIDRQFEVTPTLKDRVGFWFDVYTKYDQNHRIIHSQRFPWIIYKIVDVSDIINATTPRVRWLRNVKADNFVKTEEARIRKSLQRIAGGRPVAEDDQTAAVLKAWNKSVRKAAREALSDVRVQTGQRNFFEDGLKVSPRYLSAMEKIFRAKKLPIELTRLPFVESSFNQEATSKVGAGGIWQFMGNTGRKFLIVDGKIDERRSPFKASEAAAMLLKENHMILGHSWPLALTAWNHGPGGVRKACAAARSKDLGTVVSRYHSKSFDFASSNFYSEFLGALYAERYNDVIFGALDRAPELVPMVVRVQRSVKVNDVIKSSGLSKEEFLLLNPDLIQAQVSNVRLPIGFRIHLPETARLSVEQLVGTKRFARAD
jgi:membrane-bound lytic murein transglycosylase D